MLFVHNYLYDSIKIILFPLTIYEFKLNNRKKLLLAELIFILIIIKLLVFYCCASEDSYVKYLNGHGYNLSYFG